MCMPHQSVRYLDHEIENHEINCRAPLKEVTKIASPGNHRLYGRTDKYSHTQDIAGTNICCWHHYTITMKGIRNDDQSLSPVSLYFFCRS